VARIVQRVANKLRGAKRRLSNVPGTVRQAWRNVFPPSFEHSFDPIESAGLRAVCHEAWPIDPATLSAWDDLADRVPTATGFHSHLWLGPLARTLVKPTRLRLILVWQGSRLAGIFPMQMRDDGLLETIGMAVTDYLDPLIDPGFETGTWRIALRILSKLRTAKRPNITFHAIRDGASCRPLLPEIARAEGFEFSESIADHTPVLTLPKTWDEFLGTLDSHERKETRRKINKIMTKGAGKIVRCSSDPTEIAKTLEHTYFLMEQAPGGKGEFVKTTLRGLLAEAVPNLIAAGKLWLTTLYVNDEPAAVTLQFPNAAGPMLYNCGYDNAKREWSPGVVLTAETIRLAIESGAPVYDMLRGQETYKYKLGAVDRPLWMMNLKKVSG